MNSTLQQKSSIIRYIDECSTYLNNHQQNMTFHFILLMNSSINTKDSSVFFFIVVEVNHIITAMTFVRRVINIFHKPIHITQKINKVLIKVLTIVFCYYSHHRTSNTWSSFPRFHIQATPPSLYEFVQLKFVSAYSTNYTCIYKFVAENIFIGKF